MPIRSRSRPTPTIPAWRPRGRTCRSSPAGSATPTPVGRVMIAGHIDVVAAGDELQWTTPAFSPQIRDGALYGRGAVDMKGGVVAGLAAMRALREAEVELDAEAVLVTVPAEEDGGAGALAAIRAGRRRCRRHHRADPPGNCHRPGGGDHLHADGDGPLGARGISARGRLGPEQARAGSARPRAERGGAQRRRDQPCHEGPGTALPHLDRAAAGRRLVVERARPGRRRGTLRRPHRPDRGRGRGRSCERLWGPPAPATSGLPSTR